jgi:2-desacetyl-2-hydroxyethyl bacteriochlorophyllide A dehydrogenase
MKAIFLDAPGSFRLAQVSEPERPTSGEVLVRVLRVGICGTDLHAFQGNQAFIKLPLILGHELAVEVLEVGPNSSELNPGDVCTVMPYLSCGTCIACRRGKTNCCVTLQVLGVHSDGGMRERIVLPAELLFKIGNIPIAEGALVEMLSIGAHAVSRASIEPDEVVLVIGLGPIGLGTIAFARERAARVVGVDISNSRLEFARRLGLADIVDGRDYSKGGIEGLLMGLDIGELPTVVFDATGSSNSMMTAIEFVPNGGRLVFVGHTLEELSFSNPELHRREITIICSRNANRNDFNTVLNLLRSGKIEVGSWITHCVSPEKLVVNFSTWIDPEAGVVKAMLEF